MAFASGVASFQRFFIDGALPEEITDLFVDALNAHAFGRSPVLPDDTQVGWVGPNHLFETELAGEQIACGRFAHLAMRIDRLRPPANVSRSYILLEEQAVREASGRDLLSKAELRKAREAALARVDEESRSGAFRRMAAYPVLIDLRDRVLYLGNTSAKVGDTVIELFRQTFGAALEPATPENVGYRLMRAANRTRALEHLEPFHLVEPPDEYGEALGDFAPDLSFLGRELLTWLWYKTDTARDSLRVQGGDSVTVMIDRSMSLRCDFGLTGSDTIIADAPAGLPEARAALKIGKQPVRAGLLIGAPAGEFRLTLDGLRLVVSGLALPEDDAERDARARIERRFELVGDAAALLDALFELFLADRTGRGWGATLQQMSAWAAGKPLTKVPHATAG